MQPVEYVKKEPELDKENDFCEDYYIEDQIDIKPTCLSASFPVTVSHTILFLSPYSNIVL